MSDYPLVLHHTLDLHIFHCGVIFFYITHCRCDYLTSNMVI